MFLYLPRSLRSISHRSYILLAVVALFLFSSCDLFEEDSEPDAGIRFISYVSGATALDAQLSGETIQATSYVPSLTPVGPSGVPGFTAVESGRRRFQVQTVSSDPELVLQGSLTMTADSLYTAYLTGETNDASMVIVSESTLSAPTEGALVRIVHANPRVGSVDAAIHEVQPSPDGGQDAGRLIETIDNLPSGETSELVQTTEGQIAILVSAGGRQAPMLLLSPIAARLYTVVVTQPAGVFGTLNFGLGAYQEEL